MVKRASTPKVTDLPPWANPDVVHDYAEGRTMGQDWNSTEGLVAQLAITADRERRASEREMNTALRFVSGMGLIQFNRMYLRMWWSCWWWGCSLVDDA